jgi:lysophospholipase L1-like esterase
MLLVLIAALCTLAPVYWVDEVRTLRPTRVLGQVGLPGRETVQGHEQESADKMRGTHWPADDSGPAKQMTTVKPQAHPVKGEGAAVSGARTEYTTALQSGPINLKQIPLLPIEGLEHLKPFFQALAQESRTMPVRVLHYGDSTLAGDGIAKTVRVRLKSQFGDGGPGFFVAGMDPRWMRRDDVRVTREGSWDVYTILHGGNQGRYGLGGIVAKPMGDGQVRVVPARSGQSLGQRLEIYTQKVRKPEALKVQINGQAVTAQRIEQVGMEQWVVDHERDIVSADLRIGESGLEVYGLVLESKGGLTWETTAVVGISSGSIRQFNAEHLAEQTRTRRPDLVVVMLGGNDASNGGILSGEGKVYREGFMRAVGVLRQGAPQAACLIMSPLDQGTLGDDGRIYSKRTMSRMVALQRQASHEMGCAFWSSWDFMGGQNAFARWLEQGLAWTDLMHLTEKGLNRVGQGLSDALLQGYEQHRRGQ